MHKMNKTRQCTQQAQFYIFDLIKAQFSLVYNNGNLNHSIQASGWSHYKSTNFDPNRPCFTKSNQFIFFKLIKHVLLAQTIALSKLKIQLNTHCHFWVKLNEDTWFDNDSIRLNQNPHIGCNTFQPLTINCVGVKSTKENIEEHPT